MNKLKPKETMYIILYLLSVFVLFSCKKETYYTVKLESITESVYASGTIKPKTYVSIKANTTDYINQIYVKEGETVNIGDTLFMSDINNELNEINAIKKQVDRARSEINDDSNIFKNIALEKRSIKEKLEISKKNVLRYKELSNIQAVSQKSYEESLLESERYEIEYLNICNKYDEKKNEIKNNLLSLERDYFKATSLLKNKIILSPIAGKIYHIEKKEGDFIKPGISILSIAQGDEYILELLVDERDITKVEEQQKVLFKTEIVFDSIFEAKVESINPVFDIETRSFKVKASLLANSLFYPESFVEANIIVRENERGFAIPTEYLLEGDIVQKNNVNNNTHVKVGMRNEEWCEIVTGLNDGDKVFLKK